jgi:TorA maturation chaperone TorD
MTGNEKETISRIMASLFYPPDQETVKQIHEGSLHSFLQRYVRSCGGDSGLLNGFLMEGDPGILLKDLGEEYSRLFSELNEEGISLVESFYKPWTLDPHCTLPFASQRGFLMGDSALHLLEIYRQCGLEAADEWKGAPDHLVLELEFLSTLYRRATDLEVNQFMKDHLDWIPLLKEEIERSRPHPFYRSALEVLDLFLGQERKRLEEKRNGEKAIH